MKFLSILTLLIGFGFGLNAQSKNVAVKNATIQWKGYKVTGSHHGNISLKSGVLVMNSKDIKGGKFVVDMTSINTKDLEGTSKNGLDNHLKNEDFFHVKKYPKAVLEFKKIGKTSPNKYYITADLTIKGKTNPIEFTLYAENGKAHTEFSVDRSLYDIKYGSESFFEGLGDRAISDEFDITIQFQY